MQVSCCPCTTYISFFTHVPESSGVWFIYGLRRIVDDVVLPAEPIWNPKINPRKGTSSKPPFPELFSRPILGFSSYDVLSPWADHKPFSPETSRKDSHPRWTTPLSSFFWSNFWFESIPELGGPSSQTTGTNLSHGNSKKMGGTEGFVESS